MKLAHEKYLTGLALLGILASNGWAKEEVNEVRDMTSDGTLSIELVSGELQVTGWDREAFELTGTLGSKKEKVKISGDEDDWKIEIKQQGNWQWKNNSGSTDLVLNVPHAAEIYLATVSADLEVEALDGEELVIETVSGDVRATVAVDTLELDTVSGDVRLTATGTELDMESVSGDLDASGVVGTLEVETVSGDFEVVGTNLEEVYASSVSGDIDMDIVLTEEAEVDLESHSGKITVMLPANTRFELDSDTFSGDIENDFGSSSDADINISAETFSGNIDIKKN